MAEAAHRTVDTNGIKMHIAEMGSGPTVLLLHGFPETWYTWRYQLKALADAGFHAVAPDLRGFGLTECPKTAAGEMKLTPLDIVGDIVGLIYALGGNPVFIIGHDVGASIPGWNMCRMRPDLVKGYVSIGIPFMQPRRPKEEGYYANRFAEPGRAERDFGRFDTATVLKNVYTLFMRSELQIANSEQEIMDLVKPSELLPSWFTEDFLKVQTELYEKSGFEAPLWFTYRNRQRNFELLSPWMNMPVSTPCLYLMGRADYLLKYPMLEEYVASGQMKQWVPNLKGTLFLPGGHFVEEDSPEEVSTALIDFFRGLQKDEPKTVQ